MNTSERIERLRKIVREHTWYLYDCVIMNQLEHIEEDFDEKDKRIKELEETNLNNVMNKDLQIAELNERIKGLEKLLITSVKRSLVFEEANMDTSKENTLLLSRLVDKDGKIDKFKGWLIKKNDKIAELEKMIKLMVERLEIFKAHDNHDNWDLCSVEDIKGHYREKAREIIKAEREQSYE